MRPTLRWLRRALRGLFLAALLLLCALLFFLLIVMGDAPQDLPAPDASAPPLSALPMDSLRFAASDLYQAEPYFGMQVLRLNLEGWPLAEVLMQTETPQGAGGAVREVRLTYQNKEAGLTATLSTLTPARYLLSLPFRGLLAATDQEWTLSGLGAVLLSDGETVHLHAQKGEIIYQIEGAFGVDLLRRLAAAAQIDPS